jgi:hypothetical protein
MSIFEELRSLCAQWDKANDEYNERAMRFAVQFGNRFAKYIEAPGPFLDPHEQKQRSYVEVLHASQDQDHNRTFEPPKNVFETLNWDDNGYWQFGLRLWIDSIAGSFPKASFIFFIRFFLGENSCEVKLEPDGTFEVNPSDDKTWKAAHDYMLNVLRRTLEAEPWKAYEQKAPPGFVHFPVRST